MIDDPNVRPWLVLGAILLVNCGATAVSAWFSGHHRLRRVVTVNLILVTCFGALLGQFGPLLSNYGNAWYAAVIGAHLVILDRFGRLAASETMPACYLAVSVALLGTYPLTFVQVLPGNEIGQAVVALAQYRPQMLIASYAALGPTLAVVDIVYSWLRPRSRTVAVIAAVVVGQAVDTAIFFPIAFYELGMEIMVTAALSGLILKIPMTLAVVAAGMMASQRVTPPISRPIPQPTTPGRRHRARAS